MNKRPILAPLLVACGALLQSGCTAPAATPAAEPTTASQAVTDESSCAAFSDVATIVTNATIGFNDGRMELQERDGWFSLATRVLDDVPMGSSEVGTAMAVLKRTAPAIDGFSSTTGIDSDSWTAGFAEVSEACESAGSTIAISVFTGG